MQRSSGRSVRSTGSYRITTHGGGSSKWLTNLYSHNNFLLSSVFQVVWSCKAMLASGTCTCIIQFISPAMQYFPLQRERERMHEELRNNLWVHRLCGSDNIYKCFMHSKFIYHLIIPLRIIESPLYFSFATKFLFMMWFRSEHRSRLTKRFTTLILFSADLSPQLYDPCSSSTFSWQFFSVNW